MDNNNNNLFTSFQHILDLDQPGVQKLLTFLQNHQGLPSNRELKIQLQYCRYWCVLAKFLYENRHLNFKLASPLKFTVVFDQEYTTDCYWYYVFYQVWSLTEMLFSELLQKLDLRKQVTCEGPIRFPLPIAKVEIYTLYIVETMALQQFCLQAIQTHCRTFHQAIPAFKDALTLRNQWLTMTNLWLIANTHKRKTEEDRRQVMNFFQACYLVVSRNTDFQNDNCIQSMGRNARIQSFLSGAEYAWTVDAERSTTAYCYEQAKKEGWRPKILSFAGTDTEITDVDKFLTECTISKIEFKQPKFIVITATTENNSISTTTTNTTEAADLVPQHYLTGLCLHLDENDKYYNSRVALRPCLAKTILFHPPATSGIGVAKATVKEEEEQEKEKVESEEEKEQK